MMEAWEKINDSDITKREKYQSVSKSTPAT